MCIRGDDMKKPADFGTYKRLRKMSFNEFNRWITEFYAAAYQDGADSVVVESDPPDHPDLVAAMEEERLYEILLSIPGIGVKRADRIMEAILKEGISYDCK